MNRKVKIAFICVHNSCRSQMAEALGKYLASDVLECYSAGTEKRTQINQDAVRLIKAKYGIDMEETQYSKLLSAIPSVDMVITMGCNVECPNLLCYQREDWGLEDPSGQADKVFMQIIQRIEENILRLKKQYASDGRAEAVRVIHSAIDACEKMVPKFARGTSQHSLLVNRIKALYIAKCLIEEVGIENYSDEELNKALAPIQSIIHKNSKARSKYEAGSKQYKRFTPQIEAMEVAELLLNWEIEKRIKN